MSKSADIQNLPAKAQATQPADKFATDSVVKILQCISSIYLLLLFSTQLQYQEENKNNSKVTNCTLWGKDKIFNSSSVQFKSLPQPETFNLSSRTVSTDILNVFLTSLQLCKVKYLFILRCWLTWFPRHTFTNTT